MMSEQSNDNARDAARKARDERLAAALRANLRRRKAAARAVDGRPSDDRQQDAPTASEDRD